MNRSTLLTLCLLALISCESRDRQQAMISANSFAIKTGQELTSYLSNNGKCPTNITGWEVAPENGRSDFTTRAGSEQILFPLKLWCKESLDFNIVLKYDMDSGTWVTGGAGKQTEISFGHFTDPKHLPIGIDENPESIATKVVHDQ